MSTKARQEWPLGRGPSMLRGEWFGTLAAARGGQPVGKLPARRAKAGLDLFAPFPGSPGGDEHCFDQGVDKVNLGDSALRREDGLYEPEAAS
jgi:hypothetical protein